MAGERKADDRVGRAETEDPGRQTDQQRAVLGGGGEEGGRPEPKSAADWSDRGAEGGTPGRPPIAIGGNSAGQGDRMPAGGGTESGTPATNPATLPGNRHHD